MKQRPAVSAEEQKLLGLTPRRGAAAMPPHEPQCISCFFVGCWGGGGESKFSRDLTALTRKSCST